jgi:hypothetical protein
MNMAMAVLARQTQQDQVTEAAASSSAPPVSLIGVLITQNGPPLKYHRMWRIMAITMKVIGMHAETGAVLHGRGMIIQCKEAAALEKLRRITGVRTSAKSKASHHAPTEGRPKAKGRALQPSKQTTGTKAEWEAKRLTCLHPADRMKEQGNATGYWWRCDACLSRWERVHEAAPPPKAAGSATTAAPRVDTVPASFQDLVNGTAPDPVGFSNRGIPMAWWQAAQMQERMRLDADIQQQQILQQQQRSNTMEAAAAAAQMHYQQQQQLAMQQQQLAMQQQQQPVSDQDLTAMQQDLHAMGPQIMPNGRETWIIPEAVNQPVENTPEYMREWIRNAYQQLLTNHSPQEAVSKILETARLSGNPAMEQMVMEESASFAPTLAPAQ